MSNNPIHKEMENVILSNNKFYDKVFIEHLKNRKVILNEMIHSGAVEMVIMQIMKWNLEDRGIPVEERIPIRMYIASEGGDVFAGLGIIDAIRNSKTPVHGIVVTYAYSMASVIFATCHKRFMMPSASVLIHDGSTAMAGSANKVKDLQKFYAKIDDMLKQGILLRSKITSEEYDANADREMYLLAEDCLAKGLCDFIIGTNETDIDCII